MFFFQMLVLTVIGFLGIRWAMKDAKSLGHNDFAYGQTDIFSWIALAIHESITTAGIFCGIFLINSLFDQFNGEHNIILGAGSKHFASDLRFAIFATNVLLSAMIIEGIRIRRHYYEFVAPLRKLYLSFPKDRLVRPSFSQLYRLW